LIKTNNVDVTKENRNETILRDIEELKKEEKIIRIGGRKDGYWQII